METEDANTANAEYQQLCTESDVNMARNSGLQTAVWPLNKMNELCKELMDAINQEISDNESDYSLELLSCNKEKVKMPQRKG